MKIQNEETYYYGARWWVVSHACLVGRIFTTSFDSYGSIGLLILFVH